MLVAECRFPHLVVFVVITEKKQGMIIASVSLLTVMLVPPGPASLTVSIFMCRPARRPQVTWKAM